MCRNHGVQDNYTVIRSLMSVVCIAVLVAHREQAYWCESQFKHQEMLS